MSLRNAGEASKGLSLWSILVFSAQFAAGMSPINSTDSVLILGAYGWAFIKPIRSFINMTITYVSAIVSLVARELKLGLLTWHFLFKERFWNGIASLKDNFAWSMAAG
jgi:nickel/cobalt transporter (NiCoT) family protein